MENELKINELDVMKLNLTPGQILIVKICADDVSQADLQQLRRQFKAVFPDNQIMLFGLPTGGEMEMSILDTEVKEKATNCSEPMSYCNDCSCGKKERIEGK